MLADRGDQLNFVGSLKVPDQVIIERIAGESRCAQRAHFIGSVTDLSLETIQIDTYT